MKAIFLDTNVFMHYEPIDQIDWVNWIEAEELRIMISRVVIQELDRHKDQHPSIKLRHRARNRLQQIERWLETGAHRLQKNVAIIADLAHPSIIFSEYGLSEHQPDDVLVAAMIQYRADHPDHDLLLVSHDVGPRLKAAAHGIPRTPAPDRYRLAQEIDPAEKEAQELRQRVQQLEHALPLLQLTFAGPSGYQNHQEITIHEGQPPPEEEIAERIDQLRRRHPPRAVQKKPSEDLFGLSAMSAGLASWHEVSPSDIREYNAKLEEYFLRYERYLRASARERIAAGLTAKLDLVLANSGGRPSNDIDVHMHFPDGPTPERSPPKRSEPPSAPSEPKTQYERTLGLGLSVPYHGATRDVRTSFPDLSPSNVGGYEIKKTNSHDVNVHFGRVKHGTHEELPPLYLVFPDFDSTSSFSFTYRLHAADVPDVVEGELHVKVRKSRKASSSKGAGS